MVRGHSASPADKEIAQRDRTNPVVNVVRASRHRDAFTGLNQDPSTYITTEQLAREVGVTYYTVRRWCQWWFGELPPGRIGKGLGYRIPFKHRHVAHGWVQSKDHDIRKIMERVLLANPNPWLVVAGKRGETFDTYQQVLHQVEHVLKSKETVHIYYIPSADPSADGGA